MEESQNDKEVHLKKIIAAILALPFPMPQEEAHNFTVILSYLTEVNNESFFKEIKAYIAEKETIVINPDYHLTITTYFDTLHNDFSRLLDEWFNSIAMTWESVVHKACAGGDFLSLVIQLLPSDTSILKKMELQAEPAHLIIKNGPAACAITTFNMAIKAKLEGLIDFEDNTQEQNIKKVAAMILLLEHMEDMQLSLNNYIHSLQKNMLLNLGKTNWLTNCKTEEEKKEFIIAILQHAQEDTLCLLPDSENICNAIEPELANKCLILLELDGILAGDKNSMVKIQCFLEKYSEHHDLFISAPRTSYNFYPFHQPETAEQKFMECVKKLSEEYALLVQLLEPDIKSTLQLSG